MVNDAEKYKVCIRSFFKIWVSAGYVSNKKVQQIYEISWILDTYRYIDVAWLHSIVFRSLISSNDVCCFCSKYDFRYR
jgi:hypothetical protein